MAVHIAPPDVAARATRARARAASLGVAGLLGAEGAVGRGVEERRCLGEQPELEEPAVGLGGGVHELPLALQPVVRLQHLTRKASVRVSGSGARPATGISWLGARSRQWRLKAAPIRRFGEPGFRRHFPCRKRIPPNIRCRQLGFPESTILCGAIIGGGRAGTQEQQMQCGRRAHFLCSEGGSLNSPPGAVPTKRLQRLERLRTPAFFILGAVGLLSTCARSPYRWFASSPPWGISHRV